MAKVQATLFGGIAPSIKAKTTVGHKTVKQLYDEGRDARDTLRKVLADLNTRFDTSTTPNAFHQIIVELERLQKSAEVAILQECRGRKVGYWVTDILEWIDSFLNQARIGQNAEGMERWTKVRRLPPREKSLYFTCCSNRIAENRWVFFSTKGKLYCRKCFVKKYGLGMENRVWITQL